MWGQLFVFVSLLKKIRGSYTIIWFTADFANMKNFNFSMSLEFYNFWNE